MHSGRVDVVLRMRKKHVNVAVVMAGPEALELAEEVVSLIPPRGGADSDMILDTSGPET